MEALFDNYYEGYDTWFDTPMGAFVDTLETDCAFSLLQPKAGMRILDAGCGTGNCSVKLAKMGASVIGVDISPAMLKIAGEKAEKNKLPITFIKADCETITFDEQFDGIISMAAFEFMANPANTYKQLKRYLKPGAPFVIGTIQKDSAWQKLYTTPQFKDSVYTRASFLSQGELESFDEPCYAGSAQCLFIPPDEPVYTLEQENDYKQRVKLGGFLCAKFLKK